MPHLDEGTIHSWLDGALSSDEAARTEAHVTECGKCAAAVAEARGFIAASSRILTALDHVPRGVVPVAGPARWGNPAVWRAAAAVLVVAVGSLLVVRNTGKDSKAEYTLIEMPDTAPVPRPAPPMTILASPAQKTAIGAAQQNTGPTGQSLGRRAATDAATATEQTLAKSGSRVADSGTTRTLSSRPSTLTAENSPAAARATGGIAESGSPAPGYASVQPGAPRILIRGVTSGTSARDSLAPPALLRVVATRRQIGATVTLYEVAPNDTVTLTESMNTRLEAVVTTGIATAHQEGRSAAKSAAAAPPQRADAAVTPQDSRREAGGVAGAAQPLTNAAPAPVMAVGSGSGVTTITWTDPTTGNVLKLSGRIPLAQLQQAKIRIERERAATAAAAKKNP